MAETSNTTHSARVDDALAAEIAAEDELELPTEEPTAPLPGELTEDERLRRSELAIALRPGAFPADRGQLLQVATSEHASDEVLELLGRLPIDTRFDTVQVVWEAAGGHRELRTAPPEPEREPQPVPEARPAIAPSAGPPVTARSGPAVLASRLVAGSVGCAFGIGRAVVRRARRIPLVNRLAGGHDG